MNYSEICRAVEQTAVRAGQYIKGEREKFDTSKIEVKGKNDFVSYVDKTSEKQIVEELSRIVPEAGFITEEGTKKEVKTINWIIDPLDGTTNFIHGLCPHCVSIALQNEGKTVVGVVYEIGMNECFSAYKGGGAFLNGKSIKVSDKQLLKDSLVGTGFPYSDYSKLDNFMKSMEFMMRNTHGMRRLGSAATDLVYVACGRLDTFYEYGLSPWDVAAGAFIVEEAGGKVSDFSGGGNYLFGKEIVAGNALVFNEFLENIKKFMA
jgi:myo-inositol-1(or 4)-monophosphatase